ncbi:MAG TPA: hypothetical protein PKH32_01875 [Verrucomicrobiota bacterium]|nr:hypothetical protein [Verrucomicrobiota bacterium]
MMTNSSRRWLVVVTFAAAMAWVESAVVYYLQTMIDRIQPHQADPMAIAGDPGQVELVRELATMLMLLAAGILAGRDWRSRLGYTAVAFGAWDIFYYVFLKVICDWPGSLLEWDLLFLIPLPWWGPVLAPVLIALLMIAWGTVAGAFRRPTGYGRSELAAWGVATVGILIALYVFMADSIAALPQGADAVRSVLPERFNWPAFVFALVCMSAPAVEFGCRLGGGAAARERAFTREQSRNPT